MSGDREIFEALGPGSSEATRQGHPAELDLDLEGAPDEVKELCLACARLVYSQLQIHVDLTSDTLPLVDHVLAVSRVETQKRPELLPLLTGATGIYFGEVLRRAIGGMWIIDGDDPARWWLCSERVFMAINPVVVAYDSLFLGTGHPGRAHSIHLAEEDRALVRARLESLPEVEPEDFYNLGTRFDVAEITLAALTASALASGHEDVRFEAADYEDLPED